MQVGRLDDAPQGFLREQDGGALPVGPRGPFRPFDLLGPELGLQEVDDGIELPEGPDDQAAMPAFDALDQ